VGGLVATIPTGDRPGARTPTTMLGAKSREPRRSTGRRARCAGSPHVVGLVRLLGNDRHAATRHDGPPDRASGAGRILEVVLGMKVSSSRMRARHSSSLSAGDVRDARGAAGVEAAPQLLGRHPPLGDALSRRDPSEHYEVFWTMKRSGGWPRVHGAAAHGRGPEIWGTTPGRQRCSARDVGVPGQRTTPSWIRAPPDR